MCSNLRYKVVVRSSRECIWYNRYFSGFYGRAREDPVLPWKGQRSCDSEFVHRQKSTVDFHWANQPKCSHEIISMHDSFDWFHVRIAMAIN